jgi:hypothetical protein
MPVVDRIEEPPLAPYTERRREFVRSGLAFILILLVVCEIAGICGIVGWSILFPIDGMSLDKVISAVKETTTLVLPPSIALAGAVMGFYYATKTE